MNSQISSRRSTRLYASLADPEPINNETIRFTGETKIDIIQTDVVIN